MSASETQVARSPEQSNEPYAWESREHLRKLCVGKQVRYYKAEYYKAEINRDLGSVWLLPNARGVDKTYSRRTRAARRTNSSAARCPLLLGRRVQSAAAIESSVAAAAHFFSVVEFSNTAAAKSS
uniref:Uncharacterized protein n=1 Tax=Phytophthora fragariae TaxID=53985 RepID=A0A6A3FI34_9STRA|nr:hypothetical protein PF009_g5448 [Phytophthora fragariae]